MSDRLANEFAASAHAADMNQAATNVRSRQRLLHGERTLREEWEKEEMIRFDLDWGAYWYEKVRTEAIKRGEWTDRKSVWDLQDKYFVHYIDE